MRREKVVIMMPSSFVFRGQVLASVPRLSIAVQNRFRYSPVY
jgi:hypothetical protein